MAVIGLLIGCALFASSHPSYSASVSILTSEDPLGEIGGISTEPLMAQNPNVAAAVIKELGLSVTPQAFLGTYSANVANVTSSTNIATNNTVINSPVLVITAAAKTAAQAESEANAVAAEFLKFRTQVLQGQATAADAAASQQVTDDLTTIASLKTQISVASAKASSAAQQQQLSKLQSKERTAVRALSAAEADAGSAKSTRQLTVSTMTSGTQILSSSPARLTASRKMTAIEDIGAPFVGFLMIGLAIVVFGAVTSNRLRRRDDIAAALGLPVRLSVSAYAGGNRILSGLSGGQRQAVDVRRIVGYLKSVLIGATHRPVTLAVVTVDNTPAVVPLVKALAAALVEERKRVAVADLSNHKLAHQLGEDQPGVHKIRLHGAGVLLVVPEMGREVETGPLSHVKSDSAAQSAIATAYAGADVFLVVASFDPALGGDYIATWATEAVVVLTAGKSSTTKIQSVGEMLRASGIHGISAIVLGADRDDDSVGSMALS